MKGWSIIITVICVLTVALGTIYFWKIGYNLKKTQMDTLYTYFPKIQDSIKAKHYPINMDSLKTAVYNQRNTVSIYTKLRALEVSVKAYHGNK